MIIDNSTYSVRARTAEEAMPRLKAMVDWAQDLDRITTVRRAKLDLDYTLTGGVTADALRTLAQPVPGLADYVIGLEANGQATAAAETWGRHLDELQAHHAQKGSQAIRIGSKTMAVVGPRYQRVPHALLAERALEAAQTGDWVPAALDASQTRMQIMMRTADPVLTVKDQDIALTWITTNGQDGMTAFRSTMGLFTFVCTNGMMLGTSLYKERVIHTQGRLAAAIARAQPATVETATISRVLNAAAEKPISDLPESYRSWLKAQGLTQTTIDAVASNSTVYDGLNCITETAHRNYKGDTRDALERTAWAFAAKYTAA